MSERHTERSPLADHAAALTLCTYCPSLCKHTCPVGIVTGHEGDTPWGMMSLADHVRRGLLEFTPEVAETFYHCVGCRACTAYCEHDIDVAGVLVAARAWAVTRGVSPHPAELFAHHALSDDCRSLDALREVARFEDRPTFSLLPGRVTLAETPEAVASLLTLCDRLDVSTISCGEACRLDVGYDLWFAGYHTDFVAQARKVFAAVEGAREIVVMSPEALYTLKHVYPRFGLTITAQLLHTSELLGPLLSGAVVRRLDERVAYHDSAYLARHLALTKSPREVLQRVLARPLVELPTLGDGPWCCGGTGAVTGTAPSTARGLSEGVLALAREAGCETIVSFAPECVAALRAVAGDDVKVEHAVSLVARAVVGDGAAA